MSMLIDTPGTLRPMLRLTMPVLAEQMLHLLVGFTDMWLTGNLLGDEAYVAAMTLMIYALWLIANLFAFVALGATAMTARFVGAGDQPLANRVMNQSITTGLIWTALVMVVACRWSASSSPSWASKARPPPRPQHTSPSSSACCRRS